MGQLFWNRREKRLRVFWRLAFTGVIFLVIYLVEAVTFGGIISFISMIGSKLSTAGNSQVSALFTKLSAVMTNLSGSLTGTMLAEAAVLVAFTCALMISARWIDRRPFSDFGFHIDRSWWRSFSFGLLLGAFLMGLIFIVEWVLGWIEIDHFFYSSRASGFIINLFLAALLFICTGFFEEMMSRGYLLRNLAECFHSTKVNAKLAVLLSYIFSSIVFGLLHMSNPNASWVSTINLFCAGLFLGLGYVLTGELGLPIGLHIAWNFFEGNVFGFAVSGLDLGTAIISIRQKGPEFWTGGAFGPEAGMLGILAILLGTTLILLWMRGRQPKVSWFENLAIYRKALPKSPSTNPPSNP